MTKQQKQITIIAAGALALVLLYRWYQNRSSSSATGVSSPSTTDPSSSDYASLAGQEQSDVAALQGQEQSDFSTLAGQVSDLTAQIAGLPQMNLTKLEHEIAQLASGEKSFNRAEHVKARKGSPFYNYYRRVTGHAPPAHIEASNFIYQGWKAGISATRLKRLFVHPSSPNRHVAHPNPGHTQQSGKHHKLPKGHRPPRPSKPKASGRRG